MIWPALHRDIQVRTPVIIEISPRDTLHESHVRQTIRSCDLGEGAIVVIVKKLGKMRVLRVRLVAHIEVKPAIAVEIRPRRGLPGMERQQPRTFGHVLKRAVT